MKKVALTTLGCKLNQYETQAIEELFEVDGYQIVDFRDYADVYVINTCTVTNKADRSSRKMVRQAIRANPEAIVVVTGCYSQLHPEEIAEIPGVDIIVGNEDKSRILELVRRYTEADEPEIIINELTRGMPCDDLVVNNFGHLTRAFLKVQDGCDYECAYCAVRFARGPSRSRELSKVMNQAQKLVDAGYKEIVLTGVHLGLYGNDLPGDIDFVTLCRNLHDINDLHRFRISSLEPNELTDELIDLTAKSNKICRHYHLPLQSGDDEILRAMNRKYDSQFFRQSVERLFAHVPDVCLGADVIVGFPGETDAHFQNTYDILSELPFAYFHIFTYSDRPNTVAIDLPNKVQPEIKKERVNRLKALRKQKLKAFREKFLGETLNVLFEHRRDHATGFLTGLSDNYIRVLADGDDSLMNEIVPVKIDQMRKGKILGIITEA